MKRNQHKRTSEPMLALLAGPKKAFDRRIIGRAFESHNGKPAREYYLHATKGFRSYK